MAPRLNVGVDAFRPSSASQGPAPSPVGRPAPTNPRAGTGKRSRHEGEGVTDASPVPVSGTMVRAGESLEPVVGSHADPSASALEASHWGEADLAIPVPVKPDEPPARSPVSGIVTKRFYGPRGHATFYDCGQCGAVVRPDANECPVCGIDFTDGES